MFGIPYLRTLPLKSLVTSVVFKESGSSSTGFPLCLTSSQSLESSVSECIGDHSFRLQLLFLIRNVFGILSKMSKSIKSFSYTVTFFYYWLNCLKIYKIKNITNPAFFITVCMPNEINAKKKKDFRQFHLENKVNLSFCKNV